MPQDKVNYLEVYRIVTMMGGTWIEKWGEELLFIDNELNQSAWAFHDLNTFP